MPSPIDWWGLNDVTPTDKALVGSKTVLMNAKVGCRPFVIGIKSVK